MELVRFEDCSSSTEALSIFEETLAEEGISTELVPVAIGLDGRSGCPGRPTILVDGEGLFPVEEHAGARAVSCRIPSTSEGRKTTQPPPWCAKRWRGASLKSDRPTHGMKGFLGLGGAPVMVRPLDHRLLSSRARLSRAVASFSRHPSPQRARAASSTLPSSNSPKTNASPYPAR
jgi:hypothetical protein